jgi:hypothetical protein
VVQLRKEKQELRDALKQTQELLRVTLAQEALGQGRIGVRLTSLIASCRKLQIGANWRDAFIGSLFSFCIETACRVARHFSSLPFTI